MRFRDYLLLAVLFAILVGVPVLVGFGLHATWTQAEHDRAERIDAATR